MSIVLHEGRKKLEMRPSIKERDPEWIEKRFQEEVEKLNEEEKAIEKSVKKVETDKKDSSLAREKKSKKSKK